MNEEIQKVTIDWGLTKEKKEMIGTIGGVYIVLVVCFMIFMFLLICGGIFLALKLSGYI